MFPPRMNRPALPLLLMGALPLAALACSSSTSTSSPLDGGAATDTGLTPVVDSGIPTACTTPLAQRPDGGSCVLEATGTLSDTSGARLPGQVMTFCGPPQCYGTKADDAGVYAIPVGDYLLTADFAIHADGRPDHAVDYHRLGANEPQVITFDMKVPSLPPSKISLPADDAGAATVSEGEITLLVPAGTTWKLDIADFTLGAAGRHLRVAPVPLASAPAYAASNNVDAIYALAPSGAKPSQKIGVRVKNSAALAASSAVDILVLSDDYFSTPPTVGILLPAAKAHVSADGTTIQTDPGEGIGEITWLAVRKGP
jgi:hypothetical protein